MKCFLQTRWLLCLFVVCAIGTTIGDPRADLASPSQEVRDNAAKILRETYKPLSPDKWKKLMESLKPGDSETRMMDLFHPRRSKGDGIAGLGWVSYCYQLDDGWGLECSFDIASGGLQQWKLYPMVDHVYVPPPANFTGVWTTYYVDGRPITQHFKDGKSEP